MFQVPGVGQARVCQCQACEPKTGQEQLAGGSLGRWVVFSGKTGSLWWFHQRKWWVKQQKRWLDQRRWRLNSQRRGIPLLKSDGFRQEEQGFDLKGTGFD